MAVAVPEFQLLLARLAADLGVKIGNLLGHMDRLDQFERLQFITDAYPELVTPYLSASNDLSATWYEEQPGDPGFIATTADLPAVDKLAASGRWALLQKTPVLAMQGTATRSVFDTSRQTVAVNAERENVRWARHASANACGFCRMLATRGAVYRGNAKAGFKAHDHCHCLAVPDRDGSYRPAPYVEKWERDYIQARKDGADSPAAIANAMDKAEGGRRAPSVKKGVPVKPPPKPPAAGSGTGVVPPVVPPKPPLTAGAGGDPQPPKRVRGMLGPDTADEFGKFGDYTPPATRSEIDDFSHDDAASVLDGDVTAEQSLDLARRIAAGERPKLPHGGHRYGTGWGKTEFDPGMGEDDVIDFARAIVDNPTTIEPHPIIVGAFVLHGTHAGVRGVVHVNPVGPGVPTWYVATVHPNRLPSVDG